MAIPKGAKRYGQGGTTKSGVTVHMYRGGSLRNQVVWISDRSGRQIGPTHPNVAPALAYAIKHGWSV